MDEHRRRLLALLGTAGVTHLAGCGSDDDGGTDGTDDPGTQTETVVPAASQTPTPTSSPTGTPPTDTDTQIRTDTPPTDTDTETPGTPTETPQPTVSKLAPEDGDGGDNFGSSVGVSSDGTTAVIGAWLDEDPNGRSGGSAYVFQWEGEQWNEETKLTPEDGDADDRFGTSVGVSSDGTTAVIGAPFEEDPNGGGAAYVFKESDDTWTQQTKFTADDGDFEDKFGESVVISGDGTVALIGAIDDEDPNGSGDGTYTGAGSAYVFEEAGGVWGQQVKLAADDGDADDEFGWSVTVSGDGTTTIIGAWNDEDPNGGSAGSAYVFQLGE